MAADATGQERIGLVAMAVGSVIIGALDWIDRPGACRFCG